VLYLWQGHFYGLQPFVHQRAECSGLRHRCLAHRRLLHIVAYGFVFYAFGMVLEASFNGAGDTWTPTYLNLFIFWLLEIPLAYILAYNFDLRPNGVFWAITAAFLMLAICSSILFKRGKWKGKVV
jgi:Na+-driven multidrug efflux pump